MKELKNIRKNITIKTFVLSKPFHRNSFFNFTSTLIQKSWNKEAGKVLKNIGIFLRKCKYEYETTNGTKYSRMDQMKFVEDSF